MGNDQKTGAVASRGAAAFRMTYPEKDMSYLVVDAYKDGYVEKDMNNKLGLKHGVFATILQLPGKKKNQPLV